MDPGAPQTPVAAPEDIRHLLERWSQSLCRKISVDELRYRCPVAHKWKAPYRSLVVREASLWRMHDLGQQATSLSEQGHILGSRILLRSAIETLGLLTYVNRKTAAVLTGELSFFDFEEVTQQVLMGSKNGSTSLAAINIVTVLAQAEKSYPGLSSMHQHLSESAHPNFDGVLYGYSSTDPEKMETQFQNNWIEFFEAQQEPATAFVFMAFESEYNIEWRQRMSELEEWLRTNDEVLEAQLSALRERQGV